MADYEGDGARWIDTLRWVQVDLRGLRDFAETLRADLDANLRIQTPEIIAQHGNGAPFGRLLGAVAAQVDVARTDYENCLAGGREALISYLEAAEVMIEATIEVAARYAYADAMAQARADEIDAALLAARRRIAEAAMTGGVVAQSGGFKTGSGLATNQA